MKKRFLSMLLVLVMLFSLLPSVVIAEGAEEHIHCMCGANKTEGTVCADCGTEAVVWTGVDAMPADDKDGYYYLTQKIEKDTTAAYTHDVAICLHGNDIVSASTTGCLSAKDGAVVSITDCDGDDTKGLITGSQNSSTFPVEAGGTLKLYNGTITGNRNGTSAGSGIIWLQKGTASKNGGAFYMYDGVITNNTVKRGTIFTDVPSAGTLPAIIQILGGEIYDNTGTNTGASTGGGAGIYSFAPVVVGGDAKIHSNTGSVTTGTIPNADIFLRNDNADYSGRLEISSDVPLVDGANIHYGTKTVEANTEDLQYITGAPANWNSKWVRYEDQKVGYADSKFFVDTSAEPEEHIHCLCGAEKTEGNTCSDCGAEAVVWTEWDGTTAMEDLDADNYYLTKSIEITAVQVISKDIAIDLCGYNITGAGNRMVYINGVTMTITDCKGTGTISKFANESGNPAIGIAKAGDKGGTLNIYGGKFTDNDSTSSNCGVINVAVGCTLNMYGGEIYGNDVVRGTIKGGTSASPCYINILGGTITGNEGSGTGSLGGGAGVYSFSPVTVGGDAKVYGNTAADTTKNADIFLRNESTYTGALVVSSQKPLETGAQINYGLWTAESDLTDLQHITGTPESWDSKWVSYDGQKVGYADSKFFVDTSAEPEEHIHCLCGAEKTEGNTCAKCGSKAVVWTETEEMPTTDGCFYLTAPVSTGAVTYTGDIHTAICLCGQTITSKNGWKIMNVEGGATVTITDCQETVGTITGSYQDKNGSTLRVNAGSTINFYNGKITGNKGVTGGDGTIYVDKGTADIIGGTFNMYGGEIYNNEARRGGAIYGVLSNGDKLPVIRILGGKIHDNTAFGTGATGGGGAICAFSPVEVGGDAVISGNVAAAGAADILLRNDLIGSYNAEGALQVSATAPLTAGAKIAYSLKVAEGDLTDLQYITGAPETWDSSWISYDGQKVGYAEGKFFVTTSSEGDGHVHCFCGAEETAGATCADCGTQAVTWTAWDGTTAMKNLAAGNYYLTKSIEITAVQVISKDIAIDLCGYNITGAGNRMVYINGKTMTITDCKGTGKITGFANDNNNPAIGIANNGTVGATLNLYGGTITDNDSTSGNCGVINLGGGCTFNMYGGEIFDNEVVRGTIKGGTTAEVYYINILGGTITGNTATGEGNLGGGAGIYSFSPVTVGGDAKIYGNTAADTGKNGDIFLRNDGSFTGALVVSAQKPLESGAQISYGLWLAEPNFEDLQYISGTPDEATWDNSWLVYDKEPVKYKDGIFYIAADIVISEHDHGTYSWISVTEETGILPTGNGYYVLDGDVKLPKQLRLADGVEVTICLNGHTLTAADGTNHFDMQPGSKLTICDCTAKTDKDGKYTAGKITGGNGAQGGFARVREGCELYLYDGIICDNKTAGNGGAVYMDAATNAHPGAEFHMYGGMLSNNFGGYGGAVRLASPKTTDLLGPTFVMEGGIICNNESPNLGGALHAAGNATVELKGGIIENNKAERSGGGVSINGTTTVNLSATIIRDNFATMHGGGMYISSGAVVNMTGSEVSGNSAKIGAGVLIQSQGTTLNLSGGKITGNKAGGGGAGGFYASNNTFFNMTGGEISYNTSEVGGAGMVLCGMTAKLTGGEIVGNKAGGNGAGICIQGSEVLLGKILISENVSTVSAGGIYVSRTGSIVSNVIIDGAQIVNNKSSGSGGGMFVYMNGNTVTMKSGKINNNQAKDGGGVIVQRECTFTLEGGEICNNSVTGSGGGYYASIDSTFIMNGGTISGNYSTGGGAGLVVLRAKATLNGGTISYNSTGKGTAAGVYINGSKASMNGTWVTNNKSGDASGGGVVVRSTTMKVDGVSTRFAGYLSITGGRISGNFTPRAGGGLLLESKDTVVDMYGGLITENTSTKFAAGVYVGTGAMFNLHDGEISYNVSENDVGGGVYHQGGGGNYTGGEIHHNVSPRSGGGLVVGGADNKVTMKNVKIYANEAKVGGGFIQQSKGCQLTMENCEIYDNKATQEGAGAYIYTYCDYYANDCHFHDNVTQGNGGAVWSWATSYVYLTDCLIEDNEAKDQGAACWTRGDGFFISGCTIRNNKAGGDGGAVYAGRMSAASDGFKPHMNIDTTTFENNVSGGQGGGVYLASGAMGKLKEVTFLNNTAAAEAGAVWAKDEFYMHSLTAIGNTSGGDGYAVYLDDSDFDGHSFIAGLMEMSGSMKIYDNHGGDLYLGKQTCLTITEDGIAEDTKINVTLHSGLLTQVVWGEYDYEGGDLKYTITYGNRSITDPELPQQAPPEEEPTETPTDNAGDIEGGKDDAPKGSAALIAIIGLSVAVVAAAAVAVVLILKKRSAAK